MMKAPLRKAVRFVLASIVGTVVYFVVGWLVFELLLGAFMDEHTTQIQGFKRSEAGSSMTMLLLSCFAYATLLSVLFEYWAEVRTVGGGVKLGAIIGVLVAIMTDSYWYSVSHFFDSALPLVVDVLAASLTVGVLGGTVGWTLGRSAPHRDQ